MTRGWFGEHVIELGNVGDDRLLVWFGGINICKEKKGVRLVIESAKNMMQPLFESERLFRPSRPIFESDITFLDRK